MLTPKTAFVHAVVLTVRQFQDAYIRQGIEGGKKAAYALYSAVLERCGNLLGDVEIIARVCANLAGLTKAMKRDGSLANDNDLKDFTLGFTQAKASFDFVDVGHGKERADTKVKGVCPQCRLPSETIASAPPCHYFYYCRPQ
jgi:hypothetical protein